MTPTASCESGRGHLTVVRGPATAPRLAASAPPVSLRGAPYRPGELPYALALALPRQLAATLDARARRSQLPVELVIRALLDGERALEQVLHRRESRVEAIKRLNSAARDHAPAVGGGELEGYRRLVQRGEAGAVTTTNGGEVELLVPLELRVAWTQEAAARGVNVDTWAADLLGAAPETATAWEGAAAASGMRLVEWAYSCLRF